MFMKIKDKSRNSKSKFSNQCDFKLCPNDKYVWLSRFLTFF